MKKGYQNLNNELIIGITILAVVLIIVIVKIWLVRLVKFKMVESSIQGFLQIDKNIGQAFSLEEISSGTNIKIERVLDVCENSALFSKTDKDKDLWKLK